jgi:hypothetical protein
MHTNGTARQVVLGRFSAVSARAARHLGLLLLVVAGLGCGWSMPERPAGSYRSGTTQMHAAECTESKSDELAALLTNPKPCTLAGQVDGGSGPSPCGSFCNLDRGTTAMGVCAGAASKTMPVAGQASSASAMHSALLSSCPA